MIPRFLFPILSFPAFIASPAAAQEVFTGLYVHGVDTPFTLDTGESGPDVELGYRFGSQQALGFLGKPAPYLLLSLNTRGDTSFAGGGLSWKLGHGPVYVRPGIGFIAHNGPSLRTRADNMRTDLGSPVLFEPELAVGTRLTSRLNIEASWVHISHATLFNSKQNPGLDMMGVRLAFSLK